MILDDILTETRQWVEASRARVPLGALEEQAATAPPVRGLGEALRAGPGIGCLAELKRRSPSKGWIRQDASVAEIARGYEAAGAAGLSVLTDTPFFGGALDDLRQARTTVALPILRKDFIIDLYQVVEARAAGADAVLLIVAALSDDELRALLGEVRRRGMQALVETHDADEVARALTAGAEIIGINHRDLRTFELDMELAIRLRPLIPPSLVVVAESGIRQPDDLRRLRDAGIDAVLVGESLMRAEDPAAALRALLGRA